MSEEFTIFVFLQGKVGGMAPGSPRTRFTIPGTLKNNDNKK